MAVLLLLVFFLVLIFAILPHFLPNISKKVVGFAVQETEDELLLREELKELQLELKGISMIDEFAKYAKTERKINKIKDQLKKITKSKTEVFLKFKIGFNVVFQVMQVLTFITVIYFYRAEPLMTWNPEWWWPVSSVIGFPTGVPGAIGITCWIVACKSFVRQAVKLSSG